MDIRPGSITALQRVFRRLSLTDYDEVGREAAAAGEVMQLEFRSSMDYFKSDADPVWQG